MKAKTVKPVAHRARCKRCGTPPLYYTFAFNRIYHVPAISGGTVGKANRGRTDYYNRPYMFLKSQFHENWLRSNGVRGVAATSSWYFKKKKDKWGGNCIILSCKCGNSHWMFNISGDHDVWLRQASLDLRKYKERHSLEDPNTVKW